MDLETIRYYLEGYWAFSKVYLGILALIFIVTVMFARHRLRAFAALLLGLYLTAGFYFLSICETDDLSLEWSTGLGIFLVGGVAVGIVFYYFVFVKATYK